MNNTLKIDKEILINIISKYPELKKFNPIIGNNLLLTKIIDEIHYELNLTPVFTELDIASGLDWDNYERIYIVLNHLLCEKNITSGGRSIKHQITNKLHDHIMSTLINGVQG